MGQEKIIESLEATIAECIESIKENNPEASVDDISFGITEYLEDILSNPDEVALGISLPNERVLRLASRKNMFMAARSKCKSRRRTSDQSRRELIQDLERVHDLLADEGKSQDANTVARNIGLLDDANVKQREALMLIDTHLNKMIKEDESDDEEDRDIKRYFEELGDTDA